MAGRHFDKEGQIGYGNAIAIHPRTNEPPPPAVAIANNVVARPREAWAQYVLRLIGAL